MELADIEVGQMVELKDKEAGFTDPVTGFDLSRSQQKKLIDPIGSSTQQALMSGRLLIVEKPKGLAGGKSKPKDSDAKDGDK